MGSKRQVGGLEIETAPLPSMPLAVWCPVPEKRDGWIPVLHNDNKWSLNPCVAKALRTTLVFVPFNPSLITTPRFISCRYAQISFNLWESGIQTLNDPHTHVWRPDPTHWKRSLLRDIGVLSTALSVALKKPKTRTLQIRSHGDFGAQIQTCAWSQLILVSICVCVCVWSFTAWEQTAWNTQSLSE